MTRPDDDPAPLVGAAEVEAVLALGRLDGALGASLSATLRIFAARVLRQILVAALRQEGHAFTDQRFHAWFAGLATLSDLPPRHARPPRVLCEAILTELAHSSWEPLADLAARFQPALLAPRDYGAGHDAEADAHEEAHAIVAAARSLISALGQAPSPAILPALARLHRAIGQDLTFAPLDRMAEPITVGTLRLTVERAPLPSPRWAIEMLWGEHWRSTGLMRHAVPFPGLIRLDALHGDTDPAEARHLMAASLRDVAQDLCAVLAEADLLVRRIEQHQPGQRSTSRAPALFALLAGFGPLRSSQIEMLFGATRLGVRGMVAALGEADLLERTTLAGVRLYAVTDHRPAVSDASEAAAAFAFSHTALDEYDASMARVEALLARCGSALDDGDGRV